MSRSIRLVVGITLVMLPLFSSFAQTATWIGAVDDRWRTGANWSTGVEPDANTDVIINFVLGNFQCTLANGGGVGRCKSLTIGTGANATVFTENDGLFVYGDLTIGANGTFTDSGGHLRVEGDWINNGVYTAGSSNRRVYFIGTAQSISGSTVTTFEKLYINSGSTVTLAQNMVVSNFIELRGTLDPTPSFFVTVGANDINIRAGGELRVKAATYAGNYTAGSAQSTANTAVINYASTTVNQTIDPSETYDILQISGSMTKSLSANTTVTRDLIIDGGTLDLQTFLADRNSSGGSLTMAASTTLKIGGTNTFPANYSSVLLATNSLVEYYGGNQTVTPESYGDLTLSATGTATKTMPGTAFSIAGDFISSTSAGTLSYTAGNNITVGGDINIGASTVFTGSTFTHTYGGNWINNGTYNGCGGSLIASGAGSTMSGSGVNNFGDLTIQGNGTVLDANTSVSVCGNFATSGGGTFTHTTGGTGTFTMTGVAKTISGSNITLDDLIVGGGGSVSTASTMTIAGDLTATGTFTASAGTISLTGTSKNILGVGSLQFFALNIPGTISTARDQSISSNLSIAGSLTASAGTTTFNGTSTLSGTANLFSTTISAASSLTMGTSATLGIANTVTLSGTFDATSNVPNTVNYNGTGAQALVLTTFSNLIVSNGNTKTPPSGLTINGNFTIGAATTFDASTFSHTVGGNWTNAGTFTAGTSTVTFTGNTDVTLTGATTFNDLTINKGAANKLTLANNIVALNVDMNAGSMQTGTNSVTINNNRTGNGIILGTITRNLAAFAEGVNYTFEGPNNFINFGAGSITGTINTITVTVTVGPVTSFVASACMNRQYSVSMGGGGTSNNATMRLHYEQNEINGNAEAASTFWRNVGSWVDQTNANTSSDVLNNWVEKTSITNIDIAALWTLSEGLIKFTWTGATSTAWGLSTNWIPVGVPAITDVVHLGDVVFTNQPIVSPAAICKKLYFDSVTPTTLTLSGGGSITVLGNIDGTWSADATHVINIGTGSLTTFGDMVLSDGVANRKINLTANTGIFNITGSLTQTGDADVTFTGAGNLNIGEDYNYVSGTFTPSTGKVTYNGLNSQVVAGLTYYNLGFDKTTGDANINSLTTVNNDFTMVTGGQVNVDGTLNVVGDVNIAASTTLNVPNSAAINVGTDWILGGTFVPGSGTVTFNGSGAQTVVATTFNNLAVNKGGGTLTLLANLGVNGNVDVTAGTVDASTFAVTRTTTGGAATLGATGFARFGGSGFQILNFASLVANPTSTIEFYGGSSRPIPPVAYGNLIITDGGTKTMVGPTGVLGDLTINTGATLAIPTTTLSLFGSIVNSGTLDGTPGTIVLNGTGETITGGFTVKELIVNGEYNVVSGNITIDDNMEVTATGDFDAGATTVTAHGDLTNSGIIFSSGITTFTGLKLQTIQLNAAISSTSTGVVNFNGTIAPILNSTSSPSLATVNINNTASINPSQPWTVAVLMNVAAGATWNGGALNHFMNGNFTNNGTVTSDGTITFGPTLFPVSISLGNNFVTTGNVIFGGTMAITLVDNTPNFTSVEINNTNAASVTAATDWIVSQDLTIGPGAEFKGGTALTHRVSGSWTNNGTFTGGTSGVVFDSNVGTDQITGGGVNNFYDITFDPLTNLDVSADLNVSKDFTNNAAVLDLTNVIVTFDGTALSILGGATVTNFDEIEINKSSNGVRMDLNASVASILTMTAGELNLNANTLSITNPLAAAVVRTGGYVLSENTSYNSVLSWAIGTDTDPHVFPFGNAAADYVPFTFDLSTGDAGTVSLATYPTAANNLPLPPGVTHVQDATGADNSANTVDRFWSISLAGETTPNADITLTASAGEVGTISTLLGQRWNGTFWDAPLPSQVSGALSAMVPGVTTFSTWAMSGNNVPLPITLVSLNARQVDNHVALDWITASEVNNDFFEIEKSVDGSKFFVIGNVKGAINSTETRAYTFSDTEIKKGMFFYRLKQVDLDKKFTYSYIVSVTIGEVTSTAVSINVFPNPTIKTLYISNEGLRESQMLITIYDPTGKVLLEKVRSSSLNGDPVALDVVGLKPGQYIVKVAAGNSSKVFRLVKTE